MKAGEIWGPKGGDRMRALLRVTGTEDGHVIAHPLYGGFELRLPEDEFASGFERCPQERLAAMEKRFERSLVGLDDFEEGQEIPCWTNGQTWNGWELPYFERRDLDPAIADGRISGGGVLVWFDEKAGTYVEAVTADGEPLPEDINRDALAEAALKAGGGEEIELPDGTTVKVSVAPVREIDTPEGRIKVYAVGDGWTWSRPWEPEASPAP